MYGLAKPYTKWGDSIHVYDGNSWKKIPGIGGKKLAVDFKGQLFVKANSHPEVQDRFDPNYDATDLLTDNGQLAMRLYQCSRQAESSASKILTGFISSAALLLYTF